ncbi:MAG TPA: protein adenylyltransferase SelO family protein, partial [Pseudobdellovibrionaceae bacterium]|nr:protein adenylyltransferase SelO family protein [Pseudobdellovibrionaceae bacterium]
HTLEDHTLEDRSLIEDLLKIFSEKKYDYTSTFYNLRKCLLGSYSFNEISLDGWVIRWREYLEQEGQTFESAAHLMSQVNPVIIPRNHWVEAALNQAVFQNDLSLFNELLEALKTPFEENLSSMKFQDPPKGDLKRYKTFCGT